MEYFGDLHTHTAHSREADNFLPIRLADYARVRRQRPGFSVVGVVDHDTMNHWEPMYRAKSLFLPGELPVLLPGIEISCCFTEPVKDAIIQTHVLGYFPELIEFNREKLTAVARIMSEPITHTLRGRETKNIDLRIAYFQKNGILPMDYDVPGLIAKIKAKYEQDVLFMAEQEPKEGDVINLPVPISDLLVLEVLHEDGVFVSVEEGKLYTDRQYADKAKKLAKILQAKENLSESEALAKAERLQGSCHGSYKDNWEKLQTQDAISLITQAGGIAILAHPMVSFKKFPGGMASFFAFCQKELLPLGLKGMEAFYPRQEEFTPQIIEFCQGNNLFVTGGSDDHQDGRNSIGDSNSMCPLEYLQEMLPGLL